MRVGSKSVWILLGYALVFLMLSGCAGYGRLTNVSKTVTVDALVDRAGEYHVYYSGYAPNNPSGILFDPRSDGRTLQPSNRWIEIEDKATMAEVVSWIKIQELPGYYPWLSQIFGPDGEPYGYLFSVWIHLVTKKIGEKTLFVYDLPDPPYYFGPGVQDQRLLMSSSSLR